MGQEQEEATLEAAAKLSIDELSNSELTAFNNFLGWESGNAREMCQDKPWFPKVKDLFTEDDGKNVHSAVRDAIDKAVKERLT